MICSVRAGLRAAAVATVGFLATVASPAYGATLYGVTEVDAGADTARLVEIDPATGGATPLFTVPISDGFTASRLTYHDPTNTLILLLRGVTSAQFRIAKIHPGTGVVTEAAITGLPMGTVEVEGLGYDPTSDSILISHGTSVATTFISKIGLDGAVLDTSSLILGTNDLDNVEYDDFNARVVGTDFNRVSTPRVFEVVDPLGFPVAVGLFSPPSNGDVGDVAIDPLTGAMYTTTFGALAGNLTRVETSEYVAVGPYDIDANVVGIAFIPAPGLASALLLAGVPGLARRRR